MKRILSAMFARSIMHHVIITILIYHMDANVKQKINVLLEYALIKDTQVLAVFAIQLPALFIR